MKLLLHEKLRLRRKRFNLDSKDKPILFELLVNGTSELVVGGSEIITIIASVKNVLLIKVGNIKIPVEPDRQQILMSLPIKEIAREGCILFIGGSKSLKFKLAVLSSKEELQTAIQETRQVDHKKSNKRFLLFSEESSDLSDQLNAKNLIHFYE